MGFGVVEEQLRLVVVSTPSPGSAAVLVTAHRSMALSVQIRGFGRPCRVRVQRPRRGWWSGAGTS